MSSQDNQVGQGEAFHFMALFLAMAKTRAISVLRIAYRKSCIMLFPLQKACLMRSVFCPREALLYVVLVVLVVFPPHQAASKQRKQPYHSIFRMNQKKVLNNIIYLQYELATDQAKTSLLSDSRLCSTATLQCFMAWKQDALTNKLNVMQIDSLKTSCSNLAKRNSRIGNRKMRHPIRF